MDKAIFVWDKILSNDFIRSQTLLLAEVKNRRSVWDQISKIHMAGEKCKTPQKISFAISSITHHILSGLTGVDQYAKRDLEGRSRHDLGIFALLCEKFQLRMYMASDLAKQLKMGPECCAFLHDWANSDHAFYYAKFGGPKTTDKADKTWIGQFSPAEQLYIKWVEELTHKVKQDGNIKARVLGMKTPKEILESSPFKEELAQMESLRLSEVAVEEKDTDAANASHEGERNDGGGAPGAGGPVLTVDFVLDQGTPKGKEGDIDSMLQRQVTSKKLQEADPSELLKETFEEAEGLVDMLCTYIVEPESADSFAIQLQGVSTGKIKGCLQHTMTPDLQSLHVWLQFQPCPTLDSMQSQSTNECSFHTHSPQP